MAMTYLEAAKLIEDHIRFHPGGGVYLPAVQLEALWMAIAVLREKSEINAPYKEVKAGTILYFVDEIQGVVEKCFVIKTEYGIRGLKFFTVKFASSGQIGQYMFSFLGYLFFLDEAKALKELHKHLDSSGEGTPDDEPDDEDGINDAIVDGIKYESFEECISSVDPGSTIKLLKDITFSSKLTINKPLILKLNGHEIKYEGSSGYLAVNNSADVSIISGKVGSKITQTGEKWAIQISGNGSLTLGENVEVNSPNSTAAILLSTGNLIVAGGTIENKVGQAIHGQSTSNIYISDGIVEGGIYAIKCQSGTSITIDSGIVVGQAGGIDAYGSGKVTINGGTINTDGYGIVAWDTVTLDVKGSAYIRGGLGICTNGSTTPSNQGVVLNLSGGVIEGNYAGAYVPSGTMNISGTVQVEGDAGVVVRGGTLNVTGGLIRASGKRAVDIGDAGYVIPVAGIAVDKNEKYNNGNVDVHISGGKITAPINLPAINFTSNGVTCKAKEGIIIDGGQFSDDSGKDYMK